MNVVCQVGEEVDVDSVGGGAEEAHLGVQIPEHQHTGRLDQVECRLWDPLG